eukprot:14043881-Alexandrium_andersonii.AAC.1
MLYQGGHRFGRFGLRHSRFRRSAVFGSVDRFGSIDIPLRSTGIVGGLRPPDPPRRASGEPA